MNAGRLIFTALAFAAALSFGSFASANVTVDRNYRMGDDPAEGALNGSPVNVTFDSAGVPGQSQLIDLNGVSTPTYRTITGRPDGVGGLGIEFNPVQSEYLRGPSLGDPNESPSAINKGGTIDYTGIVNRGMQFWVKPQATTAQTLVMDTNQHGARINAAGKFSMRYNNRDFDSNLSVVPNTWYHVMVVRPSGAANGSRMYVNGNAVAFAAGGYDDDLSQLVVGSNTGGDEVTFTGGTTEFFNGVIDDLELFVMGSNTTANYGTFNLVTDNKYIAHFLSPVAGDVTNNGVLDAADKTAFLAGWYDKNLVPTTNGFITTFTRLGDLASHNAGDLNFDGITDIFDLVILQNALTGAGLPAITPAELAAASVPEPSTAVLLGLVSTLLPAAVRKIRR
jgi:hypothetical protein